MPSPTVTIGLPVFNAAPFLHDCLRSIFAQSWSDWELIVADDGSTDESLSILKGVFDPRIRFVGPNRHQGLGACLNLITQNAQGDYIARMDADDMMHPARLERQLQVLLQRPDLDGVGCGMIVLDQALKPIGTKLNPIDHVAICADPLNGIKLAHATLIGRTEWFRNHLYNSNSYGCEDWELLLSTFEVSQFANLPEPLYFYREMDSFTVSKYLLRQARSSYFSWLHRKRFGRSRTASQCAERFGRGLLYATAGIVGTSRLLVRRRYLPANKLCVNQFQDTIEQIRSVRLPGCPSGPRKHSR